MSVKNCLVITHHANGEKYVVSPNNGKDSHFSRKDAQREAQAHVTNKIAVRAEIVKLVQEVN